ncbi:MAG: bacteriohemerythrin [Bacteroidales bacterium]
MGFFTWKDSFAFGIESIDQDHKRLVEMIDELYSAMSQGKAKEVVNDIVAGLIDYTKVHFRREEMYMKSVGYNDFEEHKRVHREFVEKVHKFQNKLKEGRTNISVEVTTFLRDWLSEHILNTDKKFVPEMIKYGIK